MLLSILQLLVKLKIKFLYPFRVRFESIKYMLNDNGYTNEFLDLLVWCQKEYKCQSYGDIFDRVPLKTLFDKAEEFKVFECDSVTLRYLQELSRSP